MYVTIEMIPVARKHYIWLKNISLKPRTYKDPPFLLEQWWQRKAINGIFHNLIDFLMWRRAYSNNVLTSGLNVSE